MLVGVEAVLCRGLDAHWMALGTAQMCTAQMIKDARLKGLSYLQSGVLTECCQWALLEGGLGHSVLCKP